MLRHDVTDHRRPIPWLRHVQSMIASGETQPPGERGTVGLEYVADGDVGAEFGQQLCFGGALPAASAGDEGDLAVEPVWNHRDVNTIPA